MTQQPEQVTRQRVLASRYTLLGELGRGGMGIVWLAEDRTIGRRVAIKELHLPAGVPPEERSILEQRVLREARTAGRLNDPGVVTVHDVVQEDGTTYIVMELIQAPTLSDVVAQQGPLPPDLVARIADQLLSALEAAHAAGVVHRDVKPSNIMLLPNGRVKLTDFGIAQSTDDPRLTTSGMLVGSPVYLPPEVIRGAQADAGSDLWALAASMFFAVEGHAAFERSTTAAIMHAILTEVPYLTRCHGPLASAIMGLLNTTPEARLSPQQVRGLLAQASHPTGGQPALNHAMVNPTGHPQAPHQTTLYSGQGASPARQRKRGPWPVVGLVALLVGGAFVGGWFGGRAGMVEPVVDEAKGATYTYGDGGQIPVFGLSQGSCGQARIEPDRSYENYTECAKPHDFEVAYRLDPFSSSEDVTYPGVAPLSKLAEASCALVFGLEEAVPEERRGELSYISLVPSEDIWHSSESPDRGMYCLIARRDGKQLTEQVIPQN